MTVSGAPSLLRRSWICVILIPIGIVLAFVLGEVLPGLMGYGWTHEGDLPLGAMLAVAIPTEALFIVPGALAAWFGFRARSAGEFKGLAPALIGLVVAGYFTLIGIVGLIGMVA